jgi:transcriptional regulator with XRE-family HTH domain
MNDFEQLMVDIEAEAQAAGPDVVAQMEAYRDQFRLASEIITLRLEANLTQKQLADRSGIQQADISRIERGEIAPTGPTFGKLAHALGVGFGFYKPIKNGLAEPIRAAATSVRSLATATSRRPATAGRAASSARTAATSPSSKRGTAKRSGSSGSVKAKSGTKRTAAARAGTSAKKNASGSKSSGTRGRHGSRSGAR